MALCSEQQRVCMARVQRSSHPASPGSSIVKEKLEAALNVKEVSVFSDTKCLR